MRCGRAPSCTIFILLSSARGQSQVQWRTGKERERRGIVAEGERKGGEWERPLTARLRRVPAACSWILWLADWRRRTRYGRDPSLTILIWFSADREACRVQLAFGMLWHILKNKSMW